jgi:hypothetical protein
MQEARKRERNKTQHWNSPNVGATNRVVLQVFREGITWQQWFIQLHWHYGQWWSSTETVLQTPGTATCITITAVFTETATIRLSVSQCVASGINTFVPLTLWKKWMANPFFYKSKAVFPFYFINSIIVVKRTTTQQLKLQSVYKSTTTCCRNIEFRAV